MANPYAQYAPGAASSDDDSKPDPTNPYAQYVNPGIGGATAPKKPEPVPQQHENSWGETILGAPMLNAMDRIGLALGLKDPKTYRGRDVPATPQPTTIAPLQQTDGERFLNAAGDAIERSPAGMAARELAPQLTADPAATAAQLAADERERRMQAENLAAGDPAWQQGAGVGANIEREAAGLTGGIAGSSLGDPTSFIMPGESILAKMAGQAGIRGAMNLGTQAAEMHQGVRDGFSPLETAEDAGGAALFTGGIEGLLKAPGALKALRDWHASRGVNTDAIPDDQLVAGSLDGSIGGTGLSHDDVANILQGRGSSMDQFSSPEAAAAAAQRAAAVQPAPNLGDAMPAGIGSKKFDKTLGAMLDERAQQTAPLPARTIPADTSIIGAPEGNIRSDDAGGIAGVDRVRAVHDQLLTEAKSKISQDPLMASILDSNISPEMKAAAVLERIKRTQADAASAPKPDMPDVPPTHAPSAFQEPTPAAATARVQRDANPGQSRIHDITMGTESAGHRYGKDGKLLTSPKGAQGEMQVMPGTSRDPGYGVRPAQNDSPEELARVGRDYIDALRAHYGGDMEKAWAAYNDGPGSVDGAIAKHGAGWLDHMPQETRAYVNKNMDALGGPRGPQPVYRAADYSASSGGQGDAYTFDAADTTADLRNHTTDNMGKAERPETFDERQAREAGSPEMATGSSTRPFKTGPAEADWEARANATHEELYKKAQEDLQREWDRRDQERRDREANKGADERFTKERTFQEEQSRGDPSGLYGGKYDQRPHKEGDFWRTTDDGYVAGKGGNPVAFRNAREAAKFAASEKLGGDFEFVSYGGQDRTGNQRVSLRRRDGSTYGQTAAPAPDAAAAAAGSEAASRFTRTDFERSEPPAGRSTDPTQRAVTGPQEPDTSIPPAAEEVHRGEPMGSGPEPAAPHPVEAPMAPEVRTETNLQEHTAPVREPVTGATQQVVTARGRPVDTQFEVHEARNLIGSSDPGFDPNLQPRDRASRSSSDAQISEISSRLDPEQLNDSRQAAQGAPIIGPDRMVESGNGRVASIRRAYEMHPDRAAEYRAMIERRGHDTSGFEQPVLVRRRTTSMNDAERGDFVREANERDTMGMSSTEQAKVDARSMSSDTLGLYRGGAVTEAGNRDFTRRWMDEVASPAERNSLMKPDGSLSADGVRRIRTSLLSKAFEDPDLVAKVVEDPDTEIRAIGNVLTDAAPAFAKLKDRVASGDLPAEYDITRQVAEAANMIARARNEGKKVADLVRQDDMFGGSTDPVTEAVTRLMFKDPAMTKPRSAADLAQGLRQYTSDVEKHSDSDMFGGGASAKRAVEVLDAARERLDAKGDKGATLFSRALDDVGKSPQEARQLSTELAGLSDHPNAAVRGLAGHLQTLVDDAVVHYGEDLGPNVHGEARLKADGTASASVTQKGDTESLLHEAVHVATLTRYGELVDGAANGTAIEGPVADLEKLRARAQKAFDRRPEDPSGQIAHGLSSTDEFLATSLTSPRMQAFLQKHNAAGLWGRLVDGVRGILGLDPKYGSLLERVLKSGAKVVEGMAKDAPRSARDVTLFSKGEKVDAEKPGPEGWKKIGNLLFEPEFTDREGPALVDAIKSTFGEPKTAMRGAWDRMKAFGEVVAYSSDSALRSMSGRFNAPTLEKLADLFHAEAGKTSSATGRTFFEAVTGNHARFDRDMAAALKPHVGSEASLGRIRDMLASPNKTVRATVEERAAAGKLRDLMKEVLEYRRDAGDSVGEVTDGYFPRVNRFDKIAKDPERFLARAEQLYRSIDAEDPKAAAAAYLQANLDGHLGIGDGLAHAGGIPGSKSSKAREFGNKADELMRDYYDTNPLTALSSYIGSSVRRAEQMRRFGPVGREGSPERAAWVKEHGDQTQWDVMRNQLKDELRSGGKASHGVVERADLIRQMNLGMHRPGTTSRISSAVSVIHTWNQLSTLGQATWASLPEMAMGFVRGGPKYGFHHLSTTFSEFARNVRNLPPSDAKRYAEAIGVVSHDSALDILRARMDDPTTMGNPAASKLLHQFYRKNGLEQWTDAGRTAAVSTGQRFIAELAGDLTSSSARARVRAAGYLRELGVKDPEAFGAMVRKGAPDADAVREDAGLSAQYSTALMRFANQTVLIPNRAVKPGWASHPLGSLIFALQSYNYAFKKNVLDRVGRETLEGIKEKDPAKLAAASGLVALTGVTALIQGVRHTLYGSAKGSQNETPTQYALETMDRTGLYGAASPIFNAFSGLRYKRSVGATLQGSVLGRTADAADAVGGLALGNNPNTNTAERHAADAVYDMVVKPAENAIGAGVLRGAAGSAVILGTGSRARNGILPSDRGAFTDAVAGPPPE